MVAKAKSPNLRGMRKRNVRSFQPKKKLDGLPLTMMARRSSITSPVTISDSLHCVLTGAAFFAAGHSGIIESID